LQTNPPPLPEPSRKRILPAFLLCLVFCAHRLYAGKYLTGFVQMIWIFASFAWFEMASSDLLALLRSGNFDFATVERISDWQQTHSTPFLPMLSLIAVGIWIAMDASLLVARKFKDGDGVRITRWI
jgi:hypothetical protein